MTSTRQALPQLSDVFLTDGGIETTLIFDDGLDLPDFAAFVLLDDADGRGGAASATSSATPRSPPATGSDACSRRRPGAPAPTGAPGSATTPTALADVNRDAVELLLEIRRRLETPTAPIVDQRLHRPARRRLPARRD